MVVEKCFCSPGPPNLVPGEEILPRGYTERWPMRTKGGQSVPGLFVARVSLEGCTTARRCVAACPSVAVHQAVFSVSE